MRIMPLLQAACLSLMLSACVAPLLMMSPTSQLMWALLKPLVDFDPNEANLFEQPLIKDRMTAMLGPNYDSTMQLLKTANELQQEGPLFYVVSRYAPVPDVAKQAGMVWNADTNQLSVMLQKGDGATQVFGENLTAATPTWPSAMQEWQAGNPTATALSGVGQAMTGSGTSLLGNMVGSLQQSATQAISSSASQAVNGATSAATQQVNKSVTSTLQQANQAVTDSAKRAVSDSATQAASSATTAQQQASKAVNDSAKQAASSVTTTVQQQANKTVSDASATVQPQADKAVSNAVSTVHKQADAGADKAIKQSDQARADAEAELEKLLN